MTTQVPEWAESIPEFLVFEELVRRGLEPGIDFFYQSPLFGGRHIRGGRVIDFYFVNPPNLAINVQGVYFHQEQGATKIADDRNLRRALAGENIILIFIDDTAILKDVRGVVGDALNYIDRSNLG